MSTDLDDFKNLPRDLVQFDHTDLDFAIYRGLNQKRAQIEDFIQEDLIKEISSELEPLKRLKPRTWRNVQNAREKALNTFSENGLGRR
ncbi:MAG: hypothetical protein ACLFTE_03880 [Salinivenus sp.]